jgi:hypothetical protein
MQLPCLAGSAGNGVDGFLFSNLCIFLMQGCRSIIHRIRRLAMNEKCICLERIGDNGPCLVHGSGYMSGAASLFASAARGESLCTGMDPIHFDDLDCPVHGVTEEDPRADETMDYRCRKCGKPAQAAILDDQDGLCTECSTRGERPC